MKLSKSILSVLMSACALWGFTSCEDNYKDPEFTVPEATIKPNTTILDLKTEFWDDAQNYIKEIGTKENGEHYVVAGRVITSDFAGNIFKSITIQDETAALTFSVNTYNLYLNYRLGQELVVDLTGLHIGKYNGLQQVGAPEWYEKGNAWEATFMAPQLFHDHVQLNGLPEPEKIVAHELSSISDIPSGSEGLIKWQSQLVRLNNVTFVPQVNDADGKTLYTFGIYHENFNQKVNLAGQELTLRTSGYSNFYQQLMPTEPSDMTCLLSYYGSDWQLMLIDYDDIENVGHPTLPFGTKENPWSIDKAIEMIAAGNAAQGWTKGYIVGTVAPEVTTVSSASDIEWGAEATLANTVVIALEPDSRDLGNCLIVPLPQDSRLREYVALRNHPENLGKELSVFGTPAALMGANGITGNNGTSSEFVLEGVEVPGGDDPNPPVAEGNGSKESPYNVDQIIAKNPTSTTVAVESGVWVSGYIVGYYADYACHFEGTSSVKVNVLLAPDASCTDAARTICIQLPVGDLRNALNLADNAGNLGRQVALKGDIMKYNSMPGIKNTSEYEWLSGGTGGETPNPPAGSGNGTESSPYSCAQIIAFNPSSTTVAVETGVWTSGYIVGYYADYACHYEGTSSVKVNILLADAATVTDPAATVCVQLPIGDVRNALNLADNASNLGKKVTLQGDIMKYNSMPGIKNTKAYKLDGQTGGGTGGDTPAGSSIYSASFASGDEGYYFHNLVMDAPLTYVWSYDASYHYMKASAYVSGHSYPSDSWMLSPILDMTAATSPELNFDHCCNKFPNSDYKQMLSLYVSVDGGKWQQLTIPTYSDNTSWSFVNSGKISLASYAGHKIQLGFRYTSTDGNSGTWEVKNIAITGSGSITTTSTTGFPSL